MLDNNNIYFYILADLVSQQNEDLFATYIQFILFKTKNNCKKFYEYLYKYNYIYKDQETIKDFRLLLSKCLEENDFENDLKFFDEVEKIQNTNYVNLINLNALGEVILNLKNKYSLENKDIKIIHDEILEYQEYIKHMLNQFNFTNISFDNSKDNLLIQLSDNISSINRKFILEALSLLQSNKLYNNSDKSNFILSTLKKLLNKVKLENILWCLNLKERAEILTIYKIEKFISNENFNIMYIKNYKYLINNIETLSENDALFLFIK